MESCYLSTLGFNLINAVAHRALFTKISLVTHIVEASKDKRTIPFRFIPPNTNLVLSKVAPLSCEVREITE